MSEREERYQKAVKAIRSTGGAVQVIKDGKVTFEKVKVARYRPGERPKYAGEDDDDSSSDEDELLGAVGKQSARAEASGAGEAASSDNGAPRRRPVITAAVEGGSDDDEEETPARRRAAAVRQRVAAEFEEEESDEEDEDALAARRARMRQLAMQRNSQQVAEESEDEMAIENEIGEEEEEEEEDESESEYETASSSEDDMAQMRPVFVKKGQRSTIADREAQERADEEKYRVAEEKLRKRVEESRNLVAQTRQEEINQAHMLAEGDINDEDEQYDETEEFEAWKVRELTRIKRDQDKRAAEDAEREEVERLRDMTEEERLEALKTREKKITNAADKGNMKFGQKYYHRGAFFMDKEEEIYKRNIMEPTLEDHFNKETMPKVMQVKNFGKIGRTKYTHLRDQDTSSKDSGWDQKNSINQRMETKRAGMKPVFERPTKKSRN